MKNTELLKESQLANQKINSQSLTKEMKEETTQQEQLVEEKPIEGTPFIARRIDDKWFMTLGHYRMTEVYESYEELREKTNLGINADGTINWHLLLNVISALMESTIKALDMEAQKQHAEQLQNNGATHIGSMEITKEED